MFNLEDFKDTLILEKVDKLNKLFDKNKLSKISKVIEEFEYLLDQQKYVIPISYILSVLAENNINLISEDLIKKIDAYLDSENEKLRVNSIIVIGFSMMANPKFLNKYFYKIARLLLDDSIDIRNNVHYFLLPLVLNNPNLADSIKKILIESLLLEESKENIISLLSALEKCTDLDFDLLYYFRNISKSLISSLKDYQTSKIYEKLLLLMKKYFPVLFNRELEKISIEELTNLLENHVLMKKYNFSQISKNTGLRLKEYLNKFKNSPLKDKKIYFYVKTLENSVFIYELEKEKILHFFDENMKIPQEKIIEKFSPIITDKTELAVFIKTLISLKIINGYYSNIGYFYPYGHIKANILNDLNNNGVIKLRKYNFLPPKFLKKILQEIIILTKEKLLLSKKRNAYYSLKKFQEQININAAKNVIIDLKSYRDRLIDEDFIKLIKNLPKEYLSEYRKGTQCVTNLGILKITEEVQNSRIVGYFDIFKISKRLAINQILLFDVFESLVDLRSGVWDTNRQIFYYSKFLKERIKSIGSISEKLEKISKIEEVAKELNIDKKHIITKIDENLQLIGEEIKKKNKININDYLEKTGMELDSFLEYINDLGLTYFKKADMLIFKPQKIEEAKNEIKYMLIDKSKSNNFISLGTYDITSSVIEELIKELLDEEKLTGIFHAEDNEVLFYTERGIRNLMLENSFLFSFNDLFYGKELNHSEIEFLKEIFDDLVKKRKLRGNFDEETLTFSSDEVLFAKDYNTVVFEFEKMVNNYIRKLETELQKIKEILTKKDETIFPQEIKLIQEIIDLINEKGVFWRNSLEAYIRKTNKKLLRDQGISIKKYKNLFSKEKKDEILSLEEDPEVNELLNTFEGWLKLFSKLELKYPNVIFYQKRLIQNPEDANSSNKLKELLDELCLV
ncbi:MAG: hypothetical protein ACFFB0_04915 [Promethearchaeota archaeon]